MGLYQIVSNCIRITELYLLDIEFYQIALVCNKWYKIVLDGIRMFLVGLDKIVHIV